MSGLARVTLLVACLGLANATPVSQEASQPLATKSDVNYRLPTHIKPINYNILLQPYLNENDAKRFKFDGECFIEIQAQQATKTLQLHIKNLNIILAEYYQKDGQAKRNLPKASPHTETSIVVYNLAEELKANTSYILHYKYIGSMDDDMHGFYRSNYTTSKNVTKWLGSTQFQRNHARRVFPSFDEPKFKATFDLSLKHHRSLKTTANTRIINITVDGEYITDVYATTPKMSTYLLAFIVSEFNDRTDGEFGVLARPEYYSQTEYSFDVGKKILKALDDYLGVPYYGMGVNKMHMAAIPDFSAGAMENWGLLTYRERGLLFDENDSSLSSKQYIASIVAHEQTHQWFGDLVTCDWWSVTWLNEGFASYFQYFATHLVESDMRMDQQFVVNDVQSVMVMDSTNSTNPMSDVNTFTEADLARMFNSISYNKAGSFIRMISHVLGAENFRKSMNQYLTTHAYTNTVPEDLLSIWKKYWPSKFTQYSETCFNSFTRQVGYPVVLFRRVSNTSFEVSQRRFLLKDFDKADPSLLYTVPITYTTSDERNYQDTAPRFFLEKNPVTISVKSSTNWVMGNIQETGYYRVNYDNATWQEIKRSLFVANWSGIHELNRAQIVDDLFNFARGSAMDYEAALEVINYLETEENYLPWYSAFTGLSYLNIRLGTDTTDFARYILGITGRVYDLVGFEEKADDKPLTIYNRANVLSWACKHGKAECIAKAKSYFNEDLRAKPVPVNIRAVVYCTAMREANDKDFEKLYNKFKTETVATEQNLLLTSLGCVREPSLVNRYFQMILSAEIRLQDKSSALSALYTSNNENVEPVFDLVDQHIEQLSNALDGYSSVASAVSNIAARFTTDAQLQKLKSFNAKHSNKFDRSISTLENAVKAVEYNLQWSSAKMGPIRTFFEAYGKNSASLASTSAVALLAAALVARLLH